MLRKLGTFSPSQVATVTPCSISKFAFLDKSRVTIKSVAKSGMLLIAVLCFGGCDQLKQDQHTKQQAAAERIPGRYLPISSDPEIALDTQEGLLCRTVAVLNSNDPLGIRNPKCGVSLEQKKLGFIPNGCTEATWVKGQQDDLQSRYSNLPLCSKIEVWERGPDGKLRPSMNTH